jgi:hypothetical protein
MELPAQVLIHNQVLGMKGSKGILLQISESGYYLCNCNFGEKTHRILLPIDNTVLIVQAPEESFEEVLEVER